MKHGYNLDVTLSQNQDNTIAHLMLGYEDFYDEMDITIPNILLKMVGTHYIEEIIDTALGHWIKEIEKNEQS